MSTTPIASLHDFAATVRGRRLDLELSQAQVAGRAGVSRQWVSSIEGGKATAELGLVLRLLTALDLRFDVAAVGDVRPARARAEAVDLDALLDDYRNDRRVL